MVHEAAQTKPKHKGKGKKDEGHKLPATTTATIP